MIARIAEAVKRTLLPELEKLGSRLDRPEGSVAEISQRLGDLNGHIVRLDQRVDQTNARIDPILIELNKIREALVRPEDYVHLRERLEALEKKVAMLSP